MSRYGEAFADSGAHGHARDLLVRAELPAGVVLDLGSGSGPLAEPVTELGLDYVGADLDGVALEELRAREFEAHALDLRGDDDALDAALRAIVGDRRVVAVLLLDVIEHLVDPGPTLRAVARLGAEDQRPLLVASIPNVSHLDVGAKLLLGRWDMTTIGLLDDTHVRFFNAGRVQATLAASGWREVDEHDVVNPFSDQQFPADSPVLRRDVPLRQLLARVRSGADPHGETYQFVRSFEYSAPVAEPAQAPAAVDGAPFLSVVVRSTGDGADPPALYGDLARQSMPDLEVLVCPDGPDARLPAAAADALAAVRVLDVDPDWRNHAIGEARGRYVVFVDTETRLAPDFVETLDRLATAGPSRVIQVGARVVGGVGGDVDASTFDRASSAPGLDLDPLDLVSIRPFGAVVLAAHAVPTAACTTVGVRFAPGPPTASTALFLLRSVELCGIVRTDEPVVAVAAGSVRNLADDLHVVAEALGSTSLVIPEGAGSYLLHVRQTAAAALREREDLTARLAAAEDRTGSLSALLVQREAELAQLTTEVEAFRASDGRRVATRLRRRLGAVAKQV